MKHYHRLKQLGALLQVLWRLLHVRSEIKYWYASVRAKRCLYVNDEGIILPVGWDFPSTELQDEEMQRINARFERRRRMYQAMKYSPRSHYLH
jgi:hypothetical protein